VSLFMPAVRASMDQDGVQKYAVTGFSLLHLGHTVVSSMARLRRSGGCGTHARDFEAGECPA
jgi:hypothetical protein